MSPSLYSNVAQCGRFPICEARLNFCLVQLSTRILIVNNATEKAILACCVQRLSRSQSSWKNRRSFRTSFREEARKRYNRRMKEEYEAELERVERIQRMQKVFDRERNKFKRHHDNWQHHDPGSYHQHFQRNDWYRKEDASFRDHGSSNFRENSWASTRTPLSHHYTSLGLIDFGEAKLEEVMVS